jgi:hypothetical protein
MQIEVLADPDAVAGGGGGLDCRRSAQTGCVSVLARDPVC